MTSGVEGGSKLNCLPTGSIVHMSARRGESSLPAVDDAEAYTIGVGM